MKKTIILFIIISCLANAFAFAQSKAEIELMKKVPLNPELMPHVFSKVGGTPNTAEKEHYPDYTFTKQNKNPFQFAFSGLYIGYKNFVSPQDVISCAFKPSCSEYGMQAVKQLGIFIGIINTFDRLQRCNGLSKEKYWFDPDSHLLYDPL
ncbi:MAG: membrane protein insertion efficiency factor YidD [Bacteroidetes bacterium]|nr:membrane protein insertion efficiency factor YidD [Bacteroidota bacterium]